MFACLQEMRSLKRTIVHLHGTPSAVVKPVRATAFTRMPLMAFDCRRVRRCLCVRAPRAAISVDRWLESTRCALTSRVHSQRVLLLICWRGLVQIHALFSTTLEQLATFHLVFVSSYPRTRQLKTNQVVGRLSVSELETPAARHARSDERRG